LEQINGREAKKMKSYCDYAKNNEESRFNDLMGLAEKCKDVLRVKKT
jgi:hypothetical protein